MLKTTSKSINNNLEQEIIGLEKQVKLLSDPIDLSKYTILDKGIRKCEGSLECYDTVLHDPDEFVTLFDENKSITEEQYKQILDKLNDIQNNI